MTKSQGLTLALYPNTRGVGYALLKTTRDLLDGAVLSCRPLSNDRLFQRIKSLIQFYRPELIILRDYNSRYNRSSKRIERMIGKISRLAAANNIPVYQYTREQVKEVFEVFGASSKYEIAAKLGAAIPALEKRIPKAPRVYQTESHSMGIFDAAALALTHAYLTE